MYKTGDLGMFKKDGNISCLGRIDNQIKIRGLRIELGEIEDKINSLPFITSCVVIKKIDSNSREILCAYFTANKTIDPMKIRKALEVFLPLYMVPGYYKQLEKLPHTPNGKIDRKSLIEIQINGNTHKTVLPRNEIDSKLVEKLKKILNTDTISIDDSFFEIGGDSLAAINLCAEIQNDFNIQLFVKDILEHPIIHELSDFISKLKETHNPCIIKHILDAEYYQVSSAQKRIYISSKMAGNSSNLYNISGGIVFNGIPDYQKIEHCINTLIRRHESLRTYFEIENENVVQKILGQVDFKLDLLENADFVNLHTLFKDFVKPFDLSKAPLLRAKFIQFSNNKSALFVDMHHIISDGMSLSILTNELNKLYNNKPLDELHISYKDFAAFENEKISSGLLNTAENYWLHQLDEIPVLYMPTNHPRPAIQVFKGGNVYSSIDENIVQKIEQLSKDLGITPYMLLLSIYYVLLSKYSSCEDIVVGSPVVGRDISETYNLIGMFVNTLALRNKIDVNSSFKSFVYTVRENMLDAYKYQTYPFDELVNKLNLKRDTSRNPIFDTMFIYQNIGYDSLDFDGIKSDFFLPDTGISKFDLSLEAIKNNSKIDLRFEYSTALFEKTFIETLSKHFLNILNSVLDNIDIKIKDITMLSKEEENKLLYEFNNTKYDYMKDKTLQSLFEEQVQKHPDNIALIFENKKLSYKELNERANLLANYLKSIGVTDKDVIGILLNRSFELIISIYAVIKSGASFVLLDNTFPEKRINFIIEDSHLKYCLINNKTKNLINFDNLLNLDNLDFSKYDLKYLEKNNTNSLCIIYTSGSTGKPKGVLLTKSGFLNLILSFDKEMEISKYKNILGIASVSFDMFMVELFSSTLMGNTLVLSNEDEQKNPIQISELIKNNNVEFFVTTPSRVELLLEKKCGNPLKNVKAFQLGGEKFSEQLYNKLISFTNAKIFNGYGPTEITACCTNKLLTKNYITIGKPLPNVQAYICDKNTNLLPIGIIGEICISGAGIANGYLNNPDLTAKKFVKNPFGNGVLYKTGDLGKFNEYGEIEYIGRQDNQIKLRGLRIELEEIETCLLKFADISKATVLKQTIESRDVICAYIVGNTKIDMRKLRKYLSIYLPEYMIPSYFIQLDSFPYTSNGKINQKALPLPNESNIDYQKDYVEPKTKLQQQVADIWQKVLNISPISITDNFFELGGDSLLAMNLNIELQEISKTLKYSDIFNFPTVEALSKKIEEDNNKLYFNKIENLSDNFVDILNNSRKREKPQKYHPKNVLLTGATGFLGIHVLEQFIKNETSNLYCIVRNSKNINPEERLRKKLNYYFGNKYDNLINKRIYVINGNILKPNFGLKPDELLHISKSIDIVVNCAANVAHFGNYEDFYNTNVTSVKYLIDFCKTFNKKLFHVSTISVIGNGTDLSLLNNKKHKKKIALDESKLYIGQILDNVYTRSKFEAERYILDAVSDGLDAYIFRMGNLMPRFKDGIFQENFLDNAFVNRIISFLKLGIIPEYLLKLRLEFSPVDYSAKAIYTLATNKFDKNRIFQLNNPNNIPVKKLFKLLKKQNYNIEILSEDDFKNKIKLILKDKSSKNLLNFLMDDFDKDLHLNYNIDIIIKSNYTIKYLRKLNFRWPRISNNYLIKFINILRKGI